MPMGPWHDGDGSPPGSLGVVCTRAEGEMLNWWRYWDGRHWSHGWITEATAKMVYRRYLNSGAELPFDERAKSRVFVWRERIDDASA